MPQTGLSWGRVVAGHGRHVLVETHQGQRVICHPRGKQNLAVVGDEVQWLPSTDEGTIEAIEPRRNLLFRQDELRTKSFAANLDLVLIWLAAEPEFSEHQLARALIATEAAGIGAAIILNKSDLKESFNRAWNRLAPYRQMGYVVSPMSLKPQYIEHQHAPPSDLEPDIASPPLSLLLGKVTLLLGPSGAGKSTLVNGLVPNAQALTGEISKALNSGKHTTTHTRWYWLAHPSDPQVKSALIDSPGFQEFGLQHLNPMQLTGLMPDIKAHAQACKFYNCTHLHEPGCGVITSVGTALAKTANSDSPPLSSDQIHPLRYKIYKDLFEELSVKRY